MLKSTFRERVAVSCLLSLCLAALLGALLLPKRTVPHVAAQAGADSLCANLRAEALGKNGILPLYATLQTLDKDGWKEFYKLVNGKDQAKLWALHFRTYMLDHDLNAEQQQFLDHLLGVIKGRDFKNPADKAYVLSQVAGIEPRAAQLFKADTPLLFKSLRGKSGATAGANLYSSCFASKAAGAEMANFERFRCDCNYETGSFFCNWEVSRESCTLTTCNGSPDGCGVFLWYPCNALCCGYWTPCY